MIGALITSAREYVEHYTNIRLGTQVWEYYLDSWPADGVVILPESPVQSMTSISYTDEDDVVTAFTDYDLGLDGYVHLGDLPSATLSDVNPIKITYTVGYTTIPSAAIAAMQLIIGHLYNNREAVVTGTIATQLPLGVNSMLDTLRRFI